MRVDLSYHLGLSPGEITARLTGNDLYGVIHCQPRNQNNDTTINSGVDIYIDTHT